MDKVDLSDANEKLARARDHIAETERRIKILIDPDFYKVVVHRDPGARQVSIQLISRAQPDKKIQATIGDAISNVRSALDYISVALVAPITGKPRDAGFPFADDAKGFAGVVAKGSLAVCSQSVRDFFIDEVQAYRCGKGHALWTLNKLRNIDKHRFLVTTLHMLGIRGSWKIGSVVMSDCELGIEEGQDKRVLLCPDNIEFTTPLRATLEVCFKEPPHVPGTSVLKFLNNAARTTQSILESLERIT